MDLEEFIFTHLLLPLARNADLVLPAAFTAVSFLRMRLKRREEIPFVEAVDIDSEIATLRAGSTVGGADPKASWDRLRSLDTRYVSLTGTVEPHPDSKLIQLPGGEDAPKAVVSVTTLYRLYKEWSDVWRQWVHGHDELSRTAVSTTFTVQPPDLATPATGPADAQPTPTITVPQFVVDPANISLPFTHSSFTSEPATMTGLAADLLSGERQIGTETQVAALPVSTPVTVYGYLRVVAPPPSPARSTQPSVLGKPASGPLPGPLELRIEARRPDPSKTPWRIFGLGGGGGGANSTTTTSSSSGGKSTAGGAAELPLMVRTEPRARLQREAASAARVWRVLAVVGGLATAGFLLRRAYALYVRYAEARQKAQDLARREAEREERRRRRRLEIQERGGPQQAAAAAAEVLAESEQCVVCMQNRRDTVLMGCRHLVLCMECSEAVRECPVCRATISGRMMIFT